MKTERMKAYREAATESFELVGDYCEQIQLLRRRVEAACDNDDEDMAKGLVANLAQTHLRLAIALLSMSVEEETNELMLPDFLMRDQ